MKKFILSLLICFGYVSLNAQSNGNYQIKFLEVNRDNSDYAVALLDENKIVFTSEGNRDSEKGNRNPRKKLFVGDMDFDGEILNVTKVNKDESNKYNTTGVSYTKDQKTVYFSRNRHARSKSKQRKSKNQRMEIFRARVDENGKWTDIEKLPFNDKKTSAGYPALSADGTKLYFVSNRLPSSGGNDIFVVNINNETEFGEPQNLGKTINTPGNETTPFINSNNVLYFASDGHKGKGGLDIFAAEVFDNHVSDVYHLEEPINSLNDDFAYIINDQTNTGYFTSNRLQGNENNDLYAFNLEKDKSLEDCFITVEGLVKDKNTQALLKNANVELFDLNNNLIESIQTADDGFYSFKVPCSEEYNLVGNSTNYKEQKQRIEILENNYHKILHSNLNLTKLMKNEVDESKDLSKILNLAPIYFDFDKVTIRSDARSELDKIVKIMKEYPEITVEANAHTDSWGPAAYNKILSEKRAKSTVNYIISQGIDPSRIIGKGFGEERLLNDCEDPSQCSRAQNQLNRRTEFIITSAATSIRLDIHKKIKKEVVDNKTKTVMEITDNSVARVNTDREIKKVELKKSTKAIDTSEKSVADVKVKSEIEKVEPKESAKKMIAERAAPETLIEPKRIDHNKTEKLVARNKKEPVKVDRIDFADLENSTTEMASINPNVKPTKIEPKEAETVLDDNVEILSEKWVTQEEEKKPKTIAKVTVTNASAEPNRSKNKALNHIDSEKSKIDEKLKTLEQKYDEVLANNPSKKQSYFLEKEKISALRKEVSEANDIGFSNIIQYNNQIISFNKTYQRLQGAENKKVPTENENIIIISESVPTKKDDKSNVTAFMEEQKEITIEKLNDIEKKFVHAKNMKPEYAENCLQEIEKIDAFRKEVKSNPLPNWDNIVAYKQTINTFHKSYKELMLQANGGISARNARFKDNSVASTRTP
ncbi:OmpA family protein [Namhaeicola litoreus]|uniref:OmpA family protein n=1 Tax=Namhaeicola litoreus TaxID=1052145 RepID=A0ABW3XZK8_9FLAO